MSLVQEPSPEREERLYELLAAHYHAVESCQAEDPQALLRRHPDLLA